MNNIEDAYSKPIVCSKCRRLFFCSFICRKIGRTSCVCNECIYHSDLFKSCETRFLSKAELVALQL